MARPKKTKTFKGVTDLINFEKVTVGASLLGVIGAIIYRFVKFGTTDQGMIYLVGLLLTGFVVRKGLSYFKPDNYYMNNKHFEPTTINNTQIVVENEEGNEDGNIPTI